MCWISILIKSICVYMCMHWCINFTNNELNNQTCRMQIILSAYGQISQMIGHKKKKKLKKLKQLRTNIFLNLIYIHVTLMFCLCVYDHEHCLYMSIGYVLWTKIWFNMCLSIVPPGGYQYFKGAVSDFWETLLIFEITKTNTALPKRITPLSW